MYLGEKGIANTENAEVLKAALHTAKQEMRMGTTMSCIKMRTGWELGVEGLWKFEYPDPFHPNAVIEDHVKRHYGEPINIALCMADTSLLSAYPAFNRLRLFSSYTSRGGTLGYFDPINYGMVVTIGTPNAPFDQQIEGVLLHEVQHLIQEAEGFAKGGNTSQGYSRYLRLAGEVEARNVVIRHSLSIENRRAKLRSDTQDVPDERQIIVI